MAEEALSKEQQLAALTADELETELQPRPNDEDDRENEEAKLNANNATDTIKVKTNQTEPETEEIKELNPVETPRQVTTAPDRDEDITGPKRAPTQFTQTKIACWMSLDLHLVDIMLAAETFEVNAWLLIFFHDPNKDFANLFESEQLDQIKQQGMTMNYILFWSEISCGKRMIYIGYIDYDDLNVSIRKKLPLKKSFLLNSSDCDIRKSYLEIYNEEEDVWNLYFRFNAHCAEHMELHSFPFDAQFLNMQVTYRIQDFYFVSECPEWILCDERYKQFQVHKPIKLTIKDSIKTQWKIEDPWIDFRLNHGKEFNFHFSVVRLRVKREPAYYLVNGVLPIFLVIACSFASFVMPIDEYLGDKFAYIITLLLTLTAFQYALAGDLPKSSETTMMDEYILYGYGILSFFTLEIAIIYELDSAGYEKSAVIFDYITVGLFAFIWLWKSIRFVIKYWKVKHSDVNWDKISDEEMRAWSKDMQGGSKYITVAEGRHLATRD